MGIAFVPEEIVIGWVTPSDQADRCRNQTCNDFQKTCHRVFPRALGAKTSKGIVSTC